MNEEFRRLSDLVQQLVGDIAVIRARLEHSAPMPEWFSIKQAAVLTGLSEDHIRRAVTGRTLSCSNVGSNDRPLYRISKGDIEKFMERRKSGALPPTKKKRGLPYSPFIRPSRMAKMQGQ